MRRRSTSASGSRKRRRRKPPYVATNWSWRPPAMPASTASSRHARSAIARTVGASPRAEDNALTSATSRAPELPRPDPCGASESVCTLQASTGRRRTPAERSASGPAPSEVRRVGNFQTLAKVSGRESNSAELRAGLLREHRARSRRRRPSLLSGGERRNVGPSTGEIEANRRGSTSDPAHRVTHQSCTVGSSPRMSIVTPRTLRFIPCSPRA